MGIWTVLRCSDDVKGNTKKMDPSLPLNAPPEIPTKGRPACEAACYKTHQHPNLWPPFISIVRPPVNQNFRPHHPQNHPPPTSFPHPTYVRDGPTLPSDLRHNHNRNFPPSLRVYLPLLAQYIRIMLKSPCKNKPNLTWHKFPTVMLRTALDNSLYDVSQETPCDQH